MATYLHTLCCAAASNHRHCRRTLAVLIVSPMHRLCTCVSALRRQRRGAGSPRPVPHLHGSFGNACWSEGTSGGGGTGRLQRGWRRRWKQRELQWQWQWRRRRRGWRARLGLDGSCCSWLGCFSGTGARRRDNSSALRAALLHAVCGASSGCPLCEVRARQAHTRGCPLTDERRVAAPCDTVRSRATELLSCALFVCTGALREGWA